MQTQDFSREKGARSAAKVGVPRISVVGLGGAGSNIVSWIKKRGLEGGRLIAANTDAMHLSMIEADRRVLLGERLVHGQGAAGHPARGAEAALDSLEDLVRETDGSDVLFLCAGLGGGTGTGAIEFYSESLRVPGRLVVAVVTLPSPAEGQRYECAKKALQHLRTRCDTVVAIDHTRLAKIDGDLAPRDALGVANELAGQFVKGVTGAMTAASLIRIDYADLCAVMGQKGLAAIGVGYAEGPGRVERAVRQAIEGELLDIKDMTKAQGVLVHVSAGGDVTREDVTNVGGSVRNLFAASARIVWGAEVDPSMNGQARVMVVATGVESAFLSGNAPRFALGPLRVGRAR